MTIKGFMRDEGGSTAIEYALIGSLIFIVIVGAVTALGGNLSGLFNNIANSMP